MLEILEWLEGTPLGAIARESLYGFQVLVGIHILGLIFSVGVLLWLDLRMIGVCLKGFPLSEIYRALSKWFIVGFSAMFLSGIALFAGFATSAYENVFFRVKILAMILEELDERILFGQRPAAVFVFDQDRPGLWRPDGYADVPSRRVGRMTCQFATLRRARHERW